MATKIGIKNQTLNSFGCIYYIEDDYTWLFVNPYRAHSWYKERVLTDLNMIFVFFILSEKFCGFSWFVKCFYYSV